MVSLDHLKTKLSGTFILIEPTRKVVANDF